MEKTKVLVVEDEPTVREVLRMLLGMEDIEVAVASDGAAGLALAEVMQPDVVLLDLMMPGLDGLEVCRSLKQAEHPPKVVVVTARASEDDKLAGLAAGADAYLRKPFSPLQIFEVVGLNGGAPAA